MFRRIYFLAFVPMILWGSAYPCSLVEDVSNTKMVKEADAIVRAEATEYIKAQEIFRESSQRENRTRLSASKSLKSFADRCLRI